MTEKWSDQELLEWAAKAAGYELSECSCKKDYRTIDREKRVYHWNPLTDDGDAFRLAVKLGLRVGSKYQRPECAIVTGWLQLREQWFGREKGEWGTFEASQEFGSDQAAAYRRCIVRAAAMTALATPSPEQGHHP